MAFEEFPKWKYHRSKVPVIVLDAAAEADLGDDWHDTPDIPPDPVKSDSPPDLPEPDQEPVIPELVRKTDELMNLQRMPKRKTS